MYCLSTTRDAPVDMMRVFKAAVCDCGFEKINYLSYSLVLICSQIWKKDLRRWQFVDGEELKAAINVHFAGKEESYFLQGIDMLISKYIEKLRLICVFYADTENTLNAAADIYNMAVSVWL